MMSNLRIALAACVILAGMAATASAGERASISKSALSSMGLGSMQQISDNEGMAVRGKGTFAGAWGTSSVSFHGTASATNGYNAGANHWHGSSLAKGATESQAGISMSFGNHTITQTIFAGGSSFGYAR